MKMDIKILKKTYRFFWCRFTRIRIVTIFVFIVLFLFISKISGFANEWIWCELIPGKGLFRQMVREMRRADINRTGRFAIGARPYHLHIIVSANLYELTIYLKIMFIGLKIVDTINIPIQFPQKNFPWLGSKIIVRRKRW